MFVFNKVQQTVMELRALQMRTTSIGSDFGKTWFLVCLSSEIFLEYCKQICALISHATTYGIKELLETKDTFENV